MTAAADSRPIDPFAGYFASVALALLFSGWAARMAVGLLPADLTPDMAGIWQQNIAAGLFVATILADPIGAFMARSLPRVTVARFAAGFLAGVLIQILVFTPVAGDGMSIYLFLSLATVGAVVAPLTRRVRLFLRRRGIAPLKRLSVIVRVLLGLPDRLVFVLLMAASFAIFWVYMFTYAQMAIGLGAVLVAIVVRTACREYEYDEVLDRENADFQAWLDLDPEQATVSLGQLLLRRLKRIASSLVPGAILFGGATRLAIDFLTDVYPGFGMDLSDPAAALQRLGIVTASGLALVLFGMVAALGLCLAILRLLGAVQNWPQERLRENYLHLIRMMYFSPIERYWDQPVEGS